MSLLISIGNPAKCEAITHFTFLFLSSNLVRDLNNRVEKGNTEEWIRDSLYYIITIKKLRHEFKVLASTLILLAYNPCLYDYIPYNVNLNKGDVLFFTSNLLHGADIHRDHLNSRVALAVRGGVPYEEPSFLIDKCVNEKMYKKIGKHVPKNKFLFSGTDEMLKKFSKNELIYNVDVFT